MSTLNNCVRSVIGPIVGLVVLLGVVAKYEADIGTARGHYRSESHEKAVAATQKIEAAFQEMYQGLRTIARLPGTRSIDRYAKNFQPTSRAAVQEIYNNLTSNVAMSEVYIVQKDFDPDRKDPVTHQPETPITTFDQFILGKTGDSAEKTSDGEDAIPEIEIDEYRLERQQLQWLRVNFPTDARIDRLNYPAICGPEVITCDNSRYSRSKPDDKDRSGLVYSVPFYGPDGRLRGCISGAILTRAVQDLLQEPSYVIRNARHDYDAVPRASGAWEKSLSFVKQAKSNPNLLYSEVLPLKIADVDGQWMLWAGQPDTLFWSRPDVKAARLFALCGGLFALIVAAAISTVLALTARFQRSMEAKNAEVEAQLREQERIGAHRNETLASLNRLLGEIQSGSGRVGDNAGRIAGLSAHVGGAAQRIESMTQTIASMSSQAANAAREVDHGTANQVRALAEGARVLAGLSAQTHEVTRDAGIAVEAADETSTVARVGTETVRIAIQSMTEIQTTVTDTAAIIRDLGQSSQRIGVIVETIGGIAEQTNLLALNAAIEAARAGDVGRGFAVVADEVRRLAVRTALATQEITSLVSLVQTQSEAAVTSMQIGTQQVTVGSSRASEAEEALRTIQEVARHSAEVVHGIRRSIESMSASSEEVSASIAHVADVAQQNSGVVTEMSQGSEHVSEAIQSMVGDLSGQVSAVAELTESSRDLMAIVHALEEAVHRADASSSPASEETDAAVSRTLVRAA